MKLITEISEELEYISETTKEGKEQFKIRGIFMQAEQQNRNKRTYPLKVLENEVKRYNKEYVSKNRAFGELGHPDGPTVNLDRVSHMISTLNKEGNDFIGEAKILNTPNGNIVRELIRAGATLGVSSKLFAEAFLILLLYLSISVSLMIPLSQTHSLPSIIPSTKAFGAEGSATMSPAVER